MPLDDRSADAGAPLPPGGRGGPFSMSVVVPVLNEEGPQKRIFMSDDRVVCLLRRRMRDSDWCVSFLNSDHDNAVTARIQDLDPDVISGRELTPGKSKGKFKAGQDISLEPGEVRVFVKA